VKVGNLPITGGVYQRYAQSAIILIIVRVVILHLTIGELKEAPSPFRSREKQAGTE
jgi:hypothetical protein